MQRLLRNDNLLRNILQNELKRQREGIELIASENFTSFNVLNLLGSVFTNKYSEGLPGKRYYGGTKYIDELESLCQKRALEAYNLDKNKWGVNVQPYSGSIANICVYMGLLNPHDRIMGLDLPSGGHLSHGFYTKNKKISKTSVMFESLPYSIKEDGYIDYNKLKENAELFNPKLIICGGSAYPRDLDYVKFYEIAKDVNSLLLADIAHISGLVATQEANNPFEYCDIVTTTTHKTLRGPRSGMIFYKKEYEELINESVFPGVQGGPHNNKIAALCHQLLEVNTPDFKNYIINVKKNANVLANKLSEYGFKISSGGTDNHIVLVNVIDKGVTGSKVEKVCDLCEISINKNTIYGDKSPMNPGGIRLGTPAMTTRNCNEEDFEKIAEFLNEAVNITIEIQKEKGKKLKDFLVDIESNDKIIELRNKVNNFARDLYFPSNSL